MNFLFACPGRCRGSAETFEMLMAQLHCNSAISISNVSGVPRQRPSGSKIGGVLAKKAWATNEKEKQKTPTILDAQDAAAARRGRSNGKSVGCSATRRRATALTAEPRHASSYKNRARLFQAIKMKDRGGSPPSPYIIRGPDRFRSILVLPLVHAQAPRPI